MDLKPHCGGFPLEIRPTNCRHVWWNAGYFGVIHTVKESLPAATTKRGELLNNFVSGAIGGTVGTIINTPFVPFLVDRSRLI